MNNRGSGGWDSTLAVRLTIHTGRWSQTMGTHYEKFERVSTSCGQLMLAAVWLVLGISHDRERARWETSASMWHSETRTVNKRIFAYSAALNMNEMWQTWKTQTARQRSGHTWDNSKFCTTFDNIGERARNRRNHRFQSYLSVDVRGL